MDRPKEPIKDEMEFGWDHDDEFMLEEDEEEAIKNELTTFGDSDSDA